MPKVFILNITAGYDCKALRRSANSILRIFQIPVLLYLIQAITKSSVFSPDKIPIHRNSPAVSWWEIVVVITIDNELANQDYSKIVQQVENSHLKSTKFWFIVA
jgi:hypothetical protein